MTLENKRGLGIPAQPISCQVFGGWVLLHIGLCFMQRYLQV